MKLGRTLTFLVDPSSFISCVTEEDADHGCCSFGWSEKKRRYVCVTCGQPRP